MKLSRTQTYNVAIANLEGNNLVNVESFKGSKKETISWLNEEIEKRILKSFMKSDIRINLCYDEDASEDLWLTVKELEEMELISLK